MEREWEGINGMCGKATVPGWVCALPEGHEGDCPALPVQGDEDATAALRAFRQWLVVNLWGAGIAADVTLHDVDQEHERQVREILAEFDRRFPHLTGEETHTR